MHLLIKELSCSKVIQSNWRLLQSNTMDILYQHFLFSQGISATNLLSGSEPDTSGMWTRTTLTPSNRIELLIHNLYRFQTQGIEPILTPYYPNFTHICFQFRLSRLHLRKECSLNHTACCGTDLNRT